MVIEKSKVIAISYELRTGNETSEVVESISTDQPLQFVYGVGYMLQEFENHLSGLNQGDNFQFKIDAEKGYGKVDPNAIVDLNKDMFKVEGELRNDLLVVGNTIPMRDQQGNRLDGRVLEVADETVKLDFNHPMAGNDLFFKGQVVEIREASQEELEHGHVHHEHHDCNGCDHC